MAKFLSAGRRVGENLRVYSIQLGELARGAFGAGVGNQDDKVKSKMLASLPAKVVQQIDIQLGHLSESSLDQVVRLATVLEAQLPAANSRLGVTEASSSAPDVDTPKGNGRPRLMVCTYCEKVGHEKSNCYLRNKTGFKSGEPGHFTKECTRRGTHSNRTQRPSVGCAFCGKGSMLWPSVKRSCAGVWHAAFVAK